MAKEQIFSEEQKKRVRAQLILSQLLLMDAPVLSAKESVLHSNVMRAMKDWCKELQKEGENSSPFTESASVVDTAALKLVDKGGKADA